MHPLPILKNLPPDHVILVLSAHCDDAEIGCGGLLRRLAHEAADGCEMRQVVFCGGDDPVRKNEQLLASREFGMEQTTIHAYPDSLLPNHWQEVKNDLLSLRDEIGSDRISMVICPRLEDRHQDHRVVAENVWRVFRNHLILEYEIPKYEGDLGRPNLYVELTQEQALEKVDLLLRCYESRSEHSWWRRDTLLALMRLRAVEANTEWAEALTARKMLL